MTDFILGFHCHQPLGNFDEVVSDATARAYLPILRALEKHRGVKVVLHFSGCLLDWSEAKAPELFDGVGALVASGQAELLGGGFYEPVLPVIPERDAIGQIEALRAYLRRRFDTRARGIWLAERVWEPRLARTLAAAGVEYLPVDDTHLLGAGLVEPDLDAAWRTGEGNATVALYPIREPLRYLIPFRPVQETLDWLRALGSKPPNGDAEPLAVMADDGEKFGVWPGTSEWVFGKGWFESFLSALEENRHWLRTTTFSERHDRCPPRRSIHVPAASYFEMGEWALPVTAGRTFREAIKVLRSEGRFEALRPFLRGGNWRHFLTKYPESGQLLRRVHALSDLIDEASAPGASHSGAGELTDPWKLVGAGLRVFSEAPPAVRAGATHVPSAAADEMPEPFAGAEELSAGSRDASDSSRLRGRPTGGGSEDAAGECLAGGPDRTAKDTLAGAAKLVETADEEEAGKLVGTGEACGTDRRARLLDASRWALWQAQCNCPYWHGVFGGIYLPFLRAFNESALVRARRLYEEAVHDEEPWLEVSAGRAEGSGGALRVDTRWLGFTADPALGGALLELESKGQDLNITSVLARREEIYHDELARPSPATTAASPATIEGTPSIHERPATGDRGPVEGFVYDAGARLALLDHLYEGVPRSEELAAGRAREISVMVQSDAVVGRAGVAAAPSAGEVLARDGADFDASAQQQPSDSPDQAGPPRRGNRSNRTMTEISLGWKGTSGAGGAKLPVGPSGRTPFSEGSLLPHGFRAPGALVLSLVWTDGIRRRKLLAVSAELASLTVTYEIAPATRGASRGNEDKAGALYFGPEIPAALWEMHGRVLWEEPSGAERVESLSFPADIDETARVTLTNDLTGLRIAIEISPPAPVRTYPLRTISRSESGYDEIYQGTIAQVLWSVPAPGEPPLRAILKLSLSRNHRPT